MVIYLGKPCLLNFYRTGDKKIRISNYIYAQSYMVRVALNREIVH